MHLKKLNEVLKRALSENEETVFFLVYGAAKNIWSRLISGKVDKLVLNHEESFGTNRRYDGLKLEVPEDDAHIVEQYLQEQGFHYEELPF